MAVRVGYKNPPTSAVCTPALPTTGDYFVCDVSICDVSTCDVGKRVSYCTSRHIAMVGITHHKPISLGIGLDS